VARSTKYRRAGSTALGARTSAKGFSGMSFFRTAARKNWRAFRTTRPTVAGAYVFPFSQMIRASASPAVISPSGLPSPKNSTSSDRAFSRLARVRGFTSGRPSM
jgi:hypothetical protein